MVQGLFDHTSLREVVEFVRKRLNLIQLSHLILHCTYAVSEVSLKQDSAFSQKNAEIECVICSENAHTLIQLSCLDLESLHRFEIFWVYTAQKRMIDIPAH